MSTITERNYLRLQLFSIDLSTEVVRDYAKHNLLGTNSTFKSFLQANQHNIYHIWSPDICCCKCIVGGPGRGIQGRFSQGQFEKLYDISGTINLRHKKRNRNGKIVETCCCNIIAVKECSLDDIDISTVCPLLLKFGNPSAQNINWITEIKAVRNTLCHAAATNVFDDITFHDLWRRLETAVCGIATNTQSSGWVINMLKTKINQMKAEDPSTEQIHTLNDQLRLEMEQIREQSVVTSDSLEHAVFVQSETNTGLQNQISEMTQCMNTVISKLDELALNFKYGRSKINVVGEIPEACESYRKGNTFQLILTVDAKNIDLNDVVSKISDAIPKINETNERINILGVRLGSIVIEACFKELTVLNSMDGLKDSLQEFLKVIFKECGLRYKKAKIDVKMSFSQSDRCPDDVNFTRKRKSDFSKDENERSSKARKSLQRYHEGNEVDSFEKQIQEVVITHFEKGTATLGLVSKTLLMNKADWHILNSLEENTTISSTVYNVNEAQNSFVNAVEKSAVFYESIRNSLGQIYLKHNSLLSEYFLIKQQLYDKRAFLDKYETSITNANQELKATNIRLNEAQIQHQRHLDKTKKGVFGDRLPIFDFIIDTVSGLNRTVANAQYKCASLEKNIIEANTTVQELKRERDSFELDVNRLTFTKSELETSIDKEHMKIENLENIREYLTKVDQILSSCSERCVHLLEQIKSKSEIKALIETVEQYECDLRSFSGLETFEKYKQNNPTKANSK
ncbi:uncharacterized protein LOC134692935 isoform X2 [Mytilus trossulus]|uniref:uncharacterized protein LOC134692935 isoform X2 n=1 Tax=Mytilus trossulus TaxID=6551 RepID=UPI003007A1BB